MSHGGCRREIRRRITSCWQIKMVQRVELGGKDQKWTFGEEKVLTFRKPGTLKVPKSLETL